MEKKLTKKELKEMEELQREKVQLRNDIISAIKSFRADVQATARYYKINNIPDKLTYGGDLKSEEEEKILRNYDVLNFVKIKYEKDEEDYRLWSFLNMMETSKSEYDKWSQKQRLIIDKKYLRDGVWNNDIVWNENQINCYLKYAKKFGYQYFITTDSSTALMEELGWLIKKGAKVVDVCTTEFYEDQIHGLVLDINDVKLEEETKKEED